MKKLIFIILLSIFFSGCLDLTDAPVWIDDANISDQNFTNLRDTPISYSGFALKCVIVNSDENGLSFAVCSSGGGGTTYSGVLPIYVDNDANIIRLDVNSASNWIGLFDGFDSNEFVLWTDSNETFYKISDINNLFGENINQMLYDSGDPHFDNTTVDGLSNTGNTSFTGNVITGSSKFLMDLIPNDDDQEYIGNAALRWKTFFVYDINAQNDINAESRFCLNGDCITEWSSSSDANVDANKVKFNVAAGTVELNDLNNLISVTQSSGYYSGGGFTDNGDGSITVAAGLGLIKETANALSETKFFSWDANATVDLVDQQVNFITVDYNSGNPRIVSQTNSPTISGSVFGLGQVFREGTEVHLFEAGYMVTDLMQRVQKRFNAEAKITLTSGGLVAEKNERYLTVTSAVLYGGLTRFATSAIDTNTVANDFEYYYTDGAGGWQYLAEDANQIDNAQYDDGGSLTALTSNRYRTDWIYLCNDGDLLVILGTNNSPTLITARNLDPPTSQPPHIQFFSTLIAKVIVREGQDNLIEVDNLVGTVFSSSGAINHNDLSSLQGGTTDEYYHLTSYLSQLIGDFNVSVETSTSKWIEVSDSNNVNRLAWAAVSKIDSNISDLAARDFSDITNRLFSLLTLDDVSGLDSFFVNESDYPFDDNNAFAEQDLNLNNNNLVSVNDGNFIDVNASGVVRSISADNFSALDGNTLRAGSNPLARICIEMTSDGNATFGFCT